MSADPRNKRSRVSVFVETGGVNLLIDTSPDMRTQALANNIRRVDAVLYTHDHADHAHGIDDMRSFNYLKNESIPVYGDAKTLGMLQEKFGYVFGPKPASIWYRASLIPNVLPDEPICHFSVENVPVTAFKQSHGRSDTLGYRIGGFAYSTDTHQLPDSAFEALEGVDVWVVDCLRYTESMTHSTVERTLGWIKKLRPRLAVLTHMGHELDYATLAAELPAGVVPGYDNMIIEL